MEYRNCTRQVLIFACKWIAKTDRNKFAGNGTAGRKGNSPPRAPVDRLTILQSSLGKIIYNLLLSSYLRFYRNAARWVIGDNCRFTSVQSQARKHVRARPGIFAGHYIHITEENLSPRSTKSTVTSWVYDHIQINMNASSRLEKRNCRAS